MFKRINHKTYQKLLAFAMITTMVITFSVTSAIPGAAVVNDKVGHVLIFFILTFLCQHSFQHHYGFLVLVGLSLFGLVIEMVQYYLPWRSFSWLDWIADLGGIVAYDVLYRLQRLYAVRRENSCR